MLDLLETFGNSKCDVTDETSNDVVETFHFQCMSKFSHEFHQFPSYLKILDNPALCLNAHSALMTENSIYKTHCQRYCMSA